MVMCGAATWGAGSITCPTVIPRRLSRMTVPATLCCAALSRYQPIKASHSAAEVAEEEGLIEPPEDEAVGHQLADEPGHAGSSGQVAGEAPNNRAQHPPTVQGEAGNEVEQPQQEVDEGHILQDRRRPGPHPATGGDTNCSSQRRPPPA